jgi:hypothetical protein
LNLTHFHGVFAPTSSTGPESYRGVRGVGGMPTSRWHPRAGRSRASLRFAAPGHPVHWAQRLKRVFAIDIETCPHCGGTSRVIACIEDPLLIAKIPVVGGTPESHLWSETNPRYLSECLKKWLIIPMLVTPVSIGRGCFPYTRTSSNSLPSWAQTRQILMRFAEPCLID